MRLKLAIGTMVAALMIMVLPITAHAATNPGRCDRDTPGRPMNKCVATLLYFNDAHDVRPVVDDGVSRGGVARLTTVINNARQQNPRSATIFGGDLAGGTLFGGVYHGAPMVDAFNRIGVDLANFGQHDFDFGVANTQDLVGRSAFPWISSNLVDGQGQPFSGRPWSVQKVGAFRIGYLGLTDAMDTTGAGAGVDQLGVVESARRQLAAMQAAEHPDVVVAITQQGPDQNADLVAKLPGIDVVLTEEVQEDRSVMTRQDGRWILAPEGNIGSVIKVDVSRHGNRITIDPSVLEVDQTVTPDPEMKQFEDHYAADLDQRLDQQIATVATPLTMPDNAHRRGEVALGDLVADAYRSGSAFADGKAADIGWIQGGGLRSEVPAGPFTVATGYGVLPFDNKVIKVRATGAQLRQALEQGLSGYGDQGGGFPQVSGIRYAFDPSRAVGSRVTSVTVGGTALDPAASYTIAMTDYVRNGGDGVTAFTDAELLVDSATARVDADVLNGFARSLQTIDYRTDGRITHD
ncbi:MAG TPA: bifunctional UDP-sugar hydrolase/5'-nucleotidase [Microlunatus sp.]